MPYTKVLLAEFVGTFALIFIGAGAVIVLAPTETVSVALAHGLVIMAFAYAFGNDSRSYVNPALAIAVVVAGEGSIKRALPVMIVQLLGGIAGAVVLAFVYGRAAPSHLGATHMDLSRTTLAGGFVLEAIGTFFLANTVLNTAVRGTAGRFAPFAIGMTVSLCIMAFGPITGGSLNPARTLGPAITVGDYSQVPVYLLAQVTGAVLAGLLYRFIWKPAQPEVRAAEIAARVAGLPSTTTTSA